MKNFKCFHITSSILVNLTLLCIAFSTDNLYILLSIFTIICLIFLSSGNHKKLKQGLVYFIPFAIITVAINMFFVQKGITTLFTIGSKSFTLEALIYALALSFKLLIVIYIFIMLGIMVDSDKAVAYFSNKLPKSTLMIMIGIKLIPTMSRRLRTLKEVYSIRGVDFNNKSWKERTASYIPMFSILLEDSMEGAFDIGEAAYIRGFLCSKRSTYDKGALGYKDFAVIILSILCLIFYFAGRILQSQSTVINDYSGSVILIDGNILASTILILILGALIFLLADIKRKY